mgnify:CR=1 FL=1
MVMFVCRSDKDKQVGGPDAGKQGKKHQNKVVLPHFEHDNITPPMSVFEKENALMEMNMSEHIRVLVGLDENKQDYNSRMDALKKLTRNIETKDVNALLLFLDLPYEEQVEITARAYNGVKNDVLSVLLQQDASPDNLGPQLVTMYRDKNHDDIWRDYCIQYIGPYYEKKWPVPYKEEENIEKDSEQQELQDVYWEAITETDGTIAGTALIGLESISRKRKEFDREEIGDTAVELARDEQYSEPTRITAFRICGMMDKKEVLPSARITAQIAETTELRRAAIATIGDLGDETDLDLIESMTGSDNERIKKAADSARKRLIERLKVPEKHSAPTI